MEGTPPIACGMLSLLALGSSLVWGTSDFLAGLTARRLPPAAVVAWSQAAGLLVMTVLVLTQLPHFPVTGWPLWSLAAGVSGAGGLVCFYAALSTGTMGVVAPVASLGVVVPVVFGILGGEQPRQSAWLGMLVAVVGVALASGPELSGDLSPRPVALACISAVGLGVALYSIDRGSRTSVLHTLWGMRLVSVVVFCLAALVLRTSGGVVARDCPVLATIGMADLLANALFAVASSRGLVSVASVLGSVYPVVTVVLARLVLQERLRLVQKVGVVLTLAGVGVIAG